MQRTSGTVRLDEVRPVVRNLSGAQSKCAGCVQDGNTDIDGLRNAIAEAKSVTDKPTLIKVPALFKTGPTSFIEQHSTAIYWRTAARILECIFDVRAPENDMHQSEKRPTPGMR